MQAAELFRQQQMKEGSGEEGKEGTDKGEDDKQAEGAASIAPMAANPYLQSLQQGGAAAAAAPPLGFFPTLQMPGGGPPPVGFPGQAAIPGMPPVADAGIPTAPAPAEEAKSTTEV